MADVELTELQTRIYEYILEHGQISKKKLATALDTQVRSLSSPLKALVGHGVLVTDEYDDYSIAAGVREDFEEGYVSVPSPSNVPEPTAPPKDDSEQVPEESADPDEENLYSDYWRVHPEELVTFYGEEGLDALKRNALTEAMKNAIGVGQKALNATLHWFDIDEEVRRDPPLLMQALEDAGVKHTLVGRIARETFLPEKQYSAYIPSPTETFIDRGRPPRRNNPTPRGRRVREDAYDDFDPDDDGYMPRKQRSTRGQGRGDDTPTWAQRLIQRLDAIDGGGQMRGYQSRDQPRTVIEPVLDEYGNPVPDPNNPDRWLERKVTYDGDVPQGVSDHKNGREDSLREIVEEQSAAITKLRDALAEHETERKISTAITPLLDKISGLERRDPVAKAGMSDAQFKLTTEKEIFQDMSASAENMISNVIEPVVEGLTDVQRMQSMREIIELERQDSVPPGTYLKYMSGGGGGGEDITKARVGSTIDMIKGKTKKVM